MAFEVKLSVPAYKPKKRKLNKRKSKMNVPLPTTT
jgi:hypothetical protein